MIPTSTETKDFLLMWENITELYFIHKRVKFKGINTKGKYVTNKTGQTGSLLIVLEKERKKERKKDRDIIARRDDKE